MKMQIEKVGVSERFVLHEQVAAQLRRAIANGEAKPGGQWSIGSVVRLRAQVAQRAVRTPGAQDGHFGGASS